MTIQHLVRLGTHSEKKYLKKFKDTYDAVVINANILAHAVNAMSSFLGCELMRKFLIDPQTYAFQSRVNLLQDNKEDVKKSIKKLIDLYGEKLSNIIINDKRSVRLSDFEGENGAAFLSELCENVINFQKNTIKNETTNNSDYSEYLEYLFEEQDNTECRPDALEPFGLIAPYFYMKESSYPSWLDINIKAIDESKKHSTNGIYAQIVFEKELLLNKEACNIISEKYIAANCEGYFLWIDSFDEKGVSSAYLNNFMDILKKFRDGNKKVYHIYGSYFSIMLTGLGFLEGTCHGMEYGETREVFPVGGGIPSSKFYLPKIHRRLLYRNALELLKDKKQYFASKSVYFQNVCSCPKCQELIENPENDFIKYGISNSTTFTRNKQSVTMSYPTTEAKENCLEHYLYVKHNEYTKVLSKRAEVLIEELQSSLNEYEEDINEIGEDIEYLNIWKKVIKEYFIPKQT